MFLLGHVILVNTLDTLDFNIYLPPPEILSTILGYSHVGLLGFLSEILHFPTVCVTSKRAAAVARCYLDIYFYVLYRTMNNSLIRYGLTDCNPL